MRKSIPGFLLYLVLLMGGPMQAYAHGGGDAVTQDPRAHHPAQSKSSLLHSAGHLAMPAATEVFSEEKEEEEDKHKAGSASKTAKHFNFSSAALLTQKLQFVIQHTPANNAIQGYSLSNTLDHLHLFIGVVRI